MLQNMYKVKKTVIFLKFLVRNEFLKVKMLYFQTKHHVTLSLIGQNLIGRKSILVCIFGK
jgi:ABC-type antimicrobial peptide transport system ATPase subunit